MPLYGSKRTIRSFKVRSLKGAYLFSLLLLSGTSFSTFAQASIYPYSLGLGPTIFVPPQSDDEVTGDSGGALMAEYTVLKRQLGLRAVLGITREQPRTDLLILRLVGSPILSDHLAFKFGGGIGGLPNADDYTYQYVDYVGHAGMTLSVPLTKSFALGFDFAAQAALFRTYSQNAPERRRNRYLLFRQFEATLLVVSEI